MSFTYAVVGAGRQGTAAAYDMARFGDAARVQVADADEAAARRAADRVNELLGRAIAEPFAVDVDRPRPRCEPSSTTSTRSCRPSPTGSTRRSPASRSRPGRA